MLICTVQLPEARDAAFLEGGVRDWLPGRVQSGAGLLQGIWLAGAPSSGRLTALLNGPIGAWQFA